MNPGPPETTEARDGAEALRLAIGWRRGWITIQRIKRRDEGRPPMELVKD